MLIVVNKPAVVNDGSLITGQALDILLAYAFIISVKFLL